MTIQLLAKGQLFLNANVERKTDLVNIAISLPSRPRQLNLLHLARTQYTVNLIISAGLILPTEGIKKDYIYSSCKQVLNSMHSQGEENNMWKH